MTEPCQLIGMPVPRVDILNKLQGKASYAEDISFPGMLYLKVLRSDRPHARILKIHTEKAEVHPGVVAVFTAKDIPGRNRVGLTIKDQPVLCDDKVRFIGDPVVLVAAETVQAAEAAVQLIRIDYDDLPGIFSPEAALAPDAAKIHETGNVLVDRKLIKGDFEQAVEQAEVVIRNTYRTGTVHHACLESGAGVATCDGDKVTVWMPSKELFTDHQEIAALLGLPPENVRAICPEVGGAFGDKRGLAPGYYAALASFKTKRPSKMVFSREECSLVTVKRHAFTIDYTTAAKKDGRILGVKADMVSDGGAYAFNSFAVLTKAMIHAAGPYEIPHVFVRARAAYTNNPITGAMRGLGVPAVALAHESQMDILAETLKMDPFEIRLKNGLKPGALTATGQRLDNSIGLTETLEKVQGEISRRGTPVPNGSKRYSWGVASMFYGIGVPGSAKPSISQLEATDAGDFVLFVGSVDVGQGSSTLFTQIVAEVLRCEAEKIRLITGDTDRCPNTGSSGASQLTYVAGRSVQMAAQNLKTLLQRAAAAILAKPEEGLVLDREGFYHPANPGRRVSMAQAVKRLKEEGLSPAAEGRFAPEVTLPDKETGQGAPNGTYAFATQGALVGVDMDSGEVEVVSLVASHDVGRIINLHGVEGQIEGSVSMGVGYALTEELVIKEGAIKNPRFGEYFIPTALDVPEVASLLVEAAEPSGPFGAKGVGEPAIVPTAPAILNAIHAATGIRVKEIPLTSEKLWMLLKKR
ncbi:MAG: xanthine dehydrogenase family protein molybdopterin-binding subunit [Deltaproteobacteria bacterium]|nr:xanthine dehydrogenase family protein molybdopterin-binding subunit [Deltaproteobacteria bacterium]